MQDRDALPARILLGPCLQRPFEAIGASKITPPNVKDRAVKRVNTEIRSAEASSAWSCGYKRLSEA